ncbi:MAG: phosphate ABC transporter, permease protein PstA [Acidobacteria bacterium 13_1_20CM_2_57_8]|nr:MAG: phosphate ABC transporter, permease protein PstA [Acidobacteria bacterium 13_1_40CM_4_58_4]OLE73745.1 MAG: phosphate ABC transporter, permease protein PstA [Acidobacteria bacterium 13_1_20CM_2_57_8]
MRKFVDRTFVVLSLAATVIILAILFVIIGNIAYHGTERLSWEFITAAPESGMTAGGIFPAIYGTVLLVLLMSLAAVPFGVLVAIFFAEYARPESRLYRWTRMAVNNLAGVPSIVFGLFGLGFFVQSIGKAIDRAAYSGRLVYAQPSILWAAMTMAVLTLPVVIITVEETLRAVPRDYREASLALGATKLQTIFRVVLPQAWSGVMTGAILAISRGAGEVAPVLFTGAAYFLPRLPSHPADQFMHLGYHIWVLTTQSTNVEATKPLLYSTVFVLLVLTFLLNITAILIRNRMRKWAVR